MEQNNRIEIFFKKNADIHEQVTSFSVKTMQTKYFVWPLPTTFYVRWCDFICQTVLNKITNTIPWAATDFTQFVCTRCDLAYKIVHVTLMSLTKIVILYSSVYCLLQRGRQYTVYCLLLLVLFCPKLLLIRLETLSKLLFAWFMNVCRVIFILYIWQST